MCFIVQQLHRKKRSVGCLCNTGQVLQSERHSGQKMRLWNWGAPLLTQSSLIGSMKMFCKHDNPFKAWSFKRKLEMRASKFLSYHCLQIFSFFSIQLKCLLDNRKCNHTGGHFWINFWETDEQLQLCQHILSIIQLNSGTGDAISNQSDN